MRTRYLLGIGFVAFVVALLRPATAQGRATLGNACIGASDFQSCDRLGDLLEHGDLPARYPEEAGLYFAFACQGGLARACERAQPWAKRYSDYETFEIDVGCMLLDNGFACEELANTLREEREEGETPIDTLPLARRRMKRALALHLDGCRRESKEQAESCLGASRVYSAGFGVAYNPREGRAKGAQACALGLAAACEDEGDHRARRDAITFYEKACDLSQGSPHACLKLARTYEATGSAPAVIGACYRRACERLSSDACAWVSRDLGSRNVTRLDGESPAVVEGFRRWCDSGAAEACALVHRTPVRLP